MSIFAAPSFYNKRDQDIYNQGFFFQPQEMFSDGVYKPPAATTTNMGGAAAATGINTVLNQGGGGGGGIPFSGTATDLTTAFQKAIDDRQDRFNNPPDRFLGFNTMRDLPPTEASSILAENIGIPQEKTFAGKAQDFLTPQSADQIIEEGYSGKVGAPGILGAILGSMDKFGTLSRGDQAFIQRNMGYTGPTVFGENTTGGAKDPFGLNVRSGFGNYAERVGIEAEKLGDLLGKTQTDKYGKGTSGISFNSATGMFEAIDPDDPRAVNAALTATQMNKMNIAKFNFYTEQTKQRDADRAAAAAAQAAAERKAAAEGRSDPNDPSRTGASGRRPGSGGTVDRRDSGPDRNVDDTGQAYDSGGREGFGYGLADGGRVYYMDGGLADLVDIYD